ncbi:uncharacterized protein LOC144140033 [Haemaphysalis longicornis]
MPWETTLTQVPVAPSGSPWTSSITSATPPDISTSHQPCHFSGHGSNATMRLTNVFRLCLLQVSEAPSKRSNNAFLVVFPCPQVLLQHVNECFYVLKLSLSGDVELNPRPNKTRQGAGQASEAPPQPTNDVVITMLRDLTARSTLIEEGQVRILDSIGSLTSKHAELNATVTSISERLGSMKSRLEVLEAHAEDLTTVQETISSLQNENFLLKARLSDLEDGARRDNLVFFNVPDHPSETWADSEKKVKKIVVNQMSINLVDNDIALAHRVGTPHRDQARPIIVKFANYKTKEKVLCAKTKLKESDIAISEDFSPATRHARKMLVDFAKRSAPDEKFKLRYNKLILNDKCYEYCEVAE